MFTLIRPRRWTTWLALWLLVLNALLPVAAQAMVLARQGGDLLEVCTSTGMVRVQADAGHASQQNPAGGAGEFNLGQHCPLCTLHDGGQALPSAGFTWVAPAPWTDWPPAFYRGVRTSTVWLAAPARAPPRV